MKFKFYEVKICHARASKGVQKKKRVEKRKGKENYLICMYVHKFSVSPIE